MKGIENETYESLFGISRPKRRRGDPLTDAEKLNISLKMRGSKHHSAVKVIHTETGKIFDTLTDASLHFGVSIATIYRVINGKTNFKLPIARYDEDSATSNKQPRRLT